MVTNYGQHFENLVLKLVTGAYYIDFLYTLNEMHEPSFIIHTCNGTDGVNGTTSVPKSVLHFVSG